MTFIRNENGCWEATVPNNPEMKVVVEGAYLVTLWHNGKECDYIVTSNNILGCCSKISDMVIQYLKNNCNVPGITCINEILSIKFGQ